MTYLFNEEDKVVREFKESLPFGVSQVQLVNAEAGETDAGKDFIELTVVNKEGVEDRARCWFVGGAANISFNTLQAIAVHQGKDDSEKEEIREAVENCSTSDELADLLNGFIGGELWFTKYYDPKRTYQGTDGVVRQSVNKNVYGYEPKEKLELMKNRDDRLNPVNSADELLDGAEKVKPGSDAAKGIPKDWA